MFSTIMVAAILSMMMLMTVMVTLHLRIIAQIPRYKSFSCFVSRTLYTTVQTYTRFCKRLLRSSANTSANKSISLCRLQESCQSSVTAAICIYDLCVFYDSIFDIIQLEFLSPAKCWKISPLSYATAILISALPFEISPFGASA